MTKFKIKHLISFSNFNYKNYLGCRRFLNVEDSLSVEDSSYFQKRHTLKCVTFVEDNIISLKTLRTTYVLFGGRIVKFYFAFND